MRLVSQAKSDCAQRDRQASRPVVDTEDRERDRHHPIHERRFFQIRDAVSRAVTQSPESSMFRAICACTASTSSMSAGGLMHATR